MYRELAEGRQQSWSVMSEMVAQSTLSMDAIHANSMELIAGSVDTVRIPGCMNPTMTPQSVPQSTVTHSSSLPRTIQYDSSIAFVCCEPSKMSEQRERVT